MVIFYMSEICVLHSLFSCHTMLSKPCGFANCVPTKRRVASEFIAKKWRIMHIYPLKSI
jgi:hypothetical protein